MGDVTVRSSASQERSGLHRRKNAMNGQGQQTSTRWAEQRVAVVGNFNPPGSGRKYQAEVLADAFESEGATVRRITTQQNRYLRPVSTLFEILGHGRAFDVACIQAFSYGNFVNAAVSIMAARRLGKRVVVVYRGGGAPQFLAKYGRFVIPVLRRVDSLVVPSGYLERVFRNHGFAPRIIPNVIDPSGFPFRPRSDFRPSMIWVRHLREGYNPQMAIEVLRRVQRDCPDATLTFVGEGALRTVLAESVERSGTQGVRFVGQVPQSAIAELLAASDIFLSTTNYDNQPRSLLEAMSAGLPVVSTNVGGVPFLVEDGKTGLLVPAKDVEAMSRAVLRIVREPGFGVRLVENARTQLQRFTWEATGPQWLKTLSDHGDE